MNFTKNPEIKKLIKIYGAALILFMLIGLALSRITLNNQYKTLYHNNAAIIGAIIEKNPELEQTIIQEIQKNDPVKAEKSKEILGKYGIHSEEILRDLPLIKRNYRLNTVLTLLLTLSIAITLIIITFILLKKLYKNINQVTTYTKKIKEGDYTLDIRDNDEGDISHLKNEIFKITLTLKEQTQALQKDKVTLSESIADISHQLKTPLTSMLVLNDILRNNPEEKDTEEFLRRTRTQLLRMEWLITTLLKLSKFDAGTIKMKKEPIKVKTLIEKTLDNLAVPIDIKTLDIHIKGDEKTKIIGDFNWTNEALINILKNCIEHTPEEGRIAITYEQNPIYTLIKIQDTGTGIEKADIPYIFNRFYKGKNAKEDSVGIGLAMAHTILKNQNGDIKVESEKGKGTTFTIKFYEPSTKN
ncbi:signal transduction histidine kinase [Natranaerovirga pectinivora]|uniref:histidine kinase n=1 Tax=Natranaerovirga pectinivora TaxID=682400 RepID=A0A4R3MHY9_9FIRM|nr:HAMP domain-containing sensor histidine kinase [Natranaerovirga pectinivora]TCT12866.1 signal transduction histidine kinase [Natranaerovirga pectinivora]